MKHNIKYVISLVFMLLMTQGAWADPTVTIIKQLNGTTTTSPGVVTSEISNGTCTLTVTPAQGNYVTKDFITVYSVVTGDVAQAPRRTPNLDNTPIEVTPEDANADPTGETHYTFAMPDDGSDVEVTVNFQSMVMYDLFIGETQVTELNASDVLKNGKVSFAPVGEANANTLTLNGATLTVPVKVGLSNLTIDIQGTNTITTEETCIQKISNTNPTVTYKSTSSEVGSLTLTNTSSEGVNNISSFSFGNEFAVLLTVYGEDDYTSNTYYFTDGSTSVAKIVPSYGVTVGDWQVYAGNASDVLKDGKVSFDKSTSKLTLNGASISGVISTSLSNLTIELVGDNTLSQGGSYAALQSSTGEAVTMTIQSTGQTTGSLTMNMPYTNAGTFADEHVTLNITSPLTVVSGSLTGNNKNDNTVVIGESYGLTVAGVTVSKFNASAITGNQIQLNNGGSVSFDLQQKTLTLNNVGFNATSSAPIISSNLDSLTVNVVGDVSFNFNETDPAYVFQSTYNNAVLTFTTTDDTPTLSIPRGIDAGAFTGFKTVEYKNGLAMSIKDGEVTSYTIALMEAPLVGDFSMDNETGVLTGYIGTANDYEGATIKYAITYADGVHQNVLETSYEESVSLEGPATLTAYIVVGESQSPVTTAKYYGYTQHEIADTLGKTSVAMPAIIPAIQEGDGLTVSYLSDEDIASVADGVIVKGGKVGTTAISAVLSIGVAEPSFTVLNDNYENGYRVEGLTVTVVPTAPSVSLEGGTYDGKQYVTLTSNLPEGVNGSIYYKRIVNGVEKIDSVYSVALTIDETTTLAYCQEAFDKDEMPFYSDTLSVTYVIRQEPGYHFSDSESGQSYYSNGSTVYNLNYGEENTLPWLINVPDGMAITYASEDEDVATINPSGEITLTGAGHVWITASNAATDEYQAHTERIRLEIKPTDPQVSLAEGVYFTGQKLTLTPTVPNGTIYYSYGYNGEKMEYTDGEEIELPEGTYDFYTYTRCVTEADNSDTDYMQSYGNNHRYYYVFDAPVISKDAGTYNGPLEVEITELPENASASAYYYFDNDEEHAMQYDAENKITVTASKTLKVYLYVEDDSGKTYKSEVIEREYTIRQDAGLAYLQNGEQVEVAVYTIGGADNLELPTLQNENELAITYSSSNTAVATVNNEGEVTIVGIGETTITATSAQTEELMAGEASYPLTVLKDLSYESITVTVADATYNMGEDVEPEVTVMDGDTDITEYVMVEYANNTQVGSQATVTITPSDDLDVNYYVGSTSATFTISNRTLTVGEDMSFASGQTWATYYNTEESLNLPAGVAAYVVTSIEGNTLNLRALNYVPKNVPVLLNQTNEAVVGYNDFDNNELIGTVQATAVSSINDGTVYVLYNGMFVKSTSGNIPANRAYLVLGAANNGPEAPSFLLFNIESTGMQMVVSDSSAEGNWYDLNGRKLSAKPTAKGLYIHNGKKKVVK